MNSRAKPQLIVWWVLWASFQFAVVLIYYFLGETGTHPQQPTSDSAAWLAGALPFALSAATRWAILPRIGDAQAALPVTIVGIALAEACCFFGLFIFPAHKQELFVISFFGILQFMPLFAARYYRGADRNG
jgi:hypothetical protein